MSLPILIADRSSSRAGGTSVKDVDDEVVATIPIKVPLPTLPLSPEATTTPVAETTLVLSDVELLAAFVQRSDPAAFTQIVERYGPMVYRVAIRAVDDPHLADDVFQATFLVLAQSAHKIRSGEVLPAWLHGTARNIARRVFIHKATERRQLAQFAMQTLAEKGGEMTPSTELDPFDELVRLNEQQLLDEELQQLPEASRAPLVLFYLEGKSQAEIAQQMGLSVEAIEGRLRRAKQELRQRLIRRGVFLSTVVAAATVLTPSIACAAPASTLVSATLATALGTTAVGTSLLGGTAASTTLSAGATTAAQLAAQEVAAMSAASKATAIFLTTAASTTVATGLLFGAIAGSLCGVPGLAPALSNSPAAEMEYPLNLVREEGGSDPFALEVVEPVLLAQVELPVTVSDPDDTNESDGRFRMTRQYDVSDFDADLRKKFVDFYKLEKSVTFRDNMMQIRALEESHWLYEMALKNYREKRNQGKLNETEFEAALSELRRVFANAPDAAIQNLKAAEQVLTDRELTHGLMDAGTGDLRRRVDLWQAVVNAVQNSKQPRPLSDKSVLMSEPNPEANPVAYQVADLDIDHKWIALEYVRTLDVYVASHESTQSFVVRANDQVHQQINEFLRNLRKAAYEKNIESVSRQLSWRLKTHSDNHSAVEQLRQLLAQLERVEKEHRVLQAEAMNNDLFSRHRKLSFFADVKEEKPAGEGEEATKLNKERDELVRQKDAEILKWQENYRNEQVEKEQIRDELARQSKELNDRISRLNQIVDFQRKQLDELNDQTSGFEGPDGKITTVDAVNGTVWLDIGRKDHLRQQVTFSVYGKPTKGIARGPQDVKAKIEVVEVRENSAIARIIEEGRDRPIEVGDLIFSPAWSAGLTEHFAIVGQGDLDGDGKRDAKDRQILKDLLDNAGAKIGLEITAGGLREPADGKLTVQTKWLIVGDLGDPTTAVNDPEKLKQILAVQEQHELLVQEAREHGIRIVSLRDFLTYLGWKPESRVYLPGGGVPFNLKPGANPPALNELAQAPAATEPLEAKPVSVAKTIPITNPETEVELPVHEIRLLKFPVPIAKAEVQYEPVLEVEPVRGQLDTLHLRAIMDGRCQLIVTGTNDAVYRVGITAGTPPKHRFREIDQNESKALNALQGQVSLEFPDNSLKEICEFIAQLHNVPVTLDTEDLKAAGADPDVHVSITAKGLSQAQALTAMLEKVKETPLDYYIDGGAIHISTVAAMKERERLVYYRLASLSPEGQAAAEKYITPLAISVAPLEGDLLVDASVFTHKKFEEYLQGAWRLESQRPARAIPLGLSAQSNRTQGAISPAPPTSPPEGTLPNSPATVPTSKLTVDPQLNQIGLQLVIFEADEAAIAKVTTKANPKSATRELVEGFGEKSNDLLRDHQAKILTRPKMYTFMGQPSQIQVGHVVPVTGDDHAALLLTSLPAGVSVQLTPRQRTREGGLLLEYQIEISTRDDASEIDVEGTSVSTVSGRTLRGFATLPAGHTDGILIGPVDTVSRSENDQPARNVSTYLWMREEVDNPYQLWPGPTKLP